jgi:hypothetical protein
MEGNLREVVQLLTAGDRSSGGGGERGREGDREATTRVCQISIRLSPGSISIEREREREKSDGGGGAGEVPDGLDKESMLVMVRKSGALAALVRLLATAGDQVCATRSLHAALRVLECDVC